MWMRAVSRVETGDASGLEDFERAIELARTMHPVSAADIFGNVGINFVDLGMLDRASELFQAAEAAAREAALAAELDYISVLRGRERYYRGDWDEALRAFEERIATTSPGFSSLELRPRTVSALIRVARGEASGALEDAGRALALARSAREQQAQHTALAVHAHVAFLVGDPGDARESAREVLELIAGQGTQQVSMSLAVLAEPVVAFGLEGAFEQALSAIRKPTPWKDAAASLVAGDPAAAAKTYRDIGSRPDEAKAHLIAARIRSTGAESHLQAALAFYRSVGAAYYVREAEALLPATA
jgi:tetratricopeptide (TPR) repeat protein